MVNDTDSTKTVARTELHVEDWTEQLKGYGMRLWAYTHECSRLTLRGTDHIARRPVLDIVFHDVSYIELPLVTGHIRAREATMAEQEQVQRALGPNFPISNVVALCATNKRVFLVEYGYVQCLVQAGK